MIKRFIGFIIILIVGLAAGVGGILVLMTLPLLALVHRGELTMLNWFRLISIPAVMLLFAAFVWRVDPWGGRTAFVDWQKRTGPRMQETMTTSPFWRGFLWVGIVCQILYLVMTVLKFKGIIK